MSDNQADEIIEEIKKALYEGNKIEAIKLHRSGTGTGLADSKAFIEKLADELYAEDPEKFSAPPNAKSGCTSMLCLIGLGTIVAWAFSSLA